MDIGLAAVICIAAAVMCKLVEKNNREFSLVIALAAALAVMVYVLMKLTQITDIVDDLFSKAGVNKQYAQIIYKALGICYITQLGSNCCRDCGESGLASAVETAGRIAILVVSLPLFNAITDIIEKLLV